MGLSVSSLKILLIEDNPDFIFLFSSLLESLGHECIQAADGMEGLDKAKEHRPDVIFCDIGLPGMDGFEVARLLREDRYCKDIYIVALTGYAGQDDLDRADKSGFNSYMVKPAGMADIKQILDKVKKQTDKTACDCPRRFTGT